MHPPRGVWGTPGGPRSKITGLADWLVTRFNTIGLDGSICSEYVVMLVDLYPESASDRAAAITEFLSDSIASSTIKTESLRIRFIEETVSSVNSRLGGSVAPPPPPARIQTPPVEAAQAAAPAGKKGLKKGIKLSGTALKEFVGNVKPSFVQKYSDDEETIVERQIPSISAGYVPFRTLPIRVDRSSGNEFPTLAVGRSRSSSYLEQGSTPVAISQVVKTKSSTARRKTKAREIGPDEAWDDADDAPSPRETPMDSSAIMMTPLESITGPAVVPEPKVRNLTVFTGANVRVSPVKEPVPGEPSPVSILDTTPPPAVTEGAQLESLILPTDLLSFDFKFEGEDEETPKQMSSQDSETGTPEPFDLLKQMFSQSGFITTAASSEDANVTRTQDHSAKSMHQDNIDVDMPKKLYSASFMLEVLKQLKERSGNNDLPVPALLSSLVYEVVTVPKLENNWRAQGPKSDELASADTDPNMGSWKASGYTQRWNRNSGASSGSHSRKSSPQKAQPAQEEGFW